MSMGIAPQFFQEPAEKVILMSDVDQGSFNQENKQEVQGARYREKLLDKQLVWHPRTGGFLFTLLYKYF